VGGDVLILPMRKPRVAEVKCFALGTQLSKWLLELQLKNLLTSSMVYFPGQYVEIQIQNGVVTIKC
jgi:hypothetical protein